MSMKQSDTAPRHLAPSPYLTSKAIILLFRNNSSPWDSPYTSEDDAEEDPPLLNLDEDDYFELLPVESWIGQLHFEPVSGEDFGTLTLYAGNGHSYTYHGVHDDHWKGFLKAEEAEDQSVGGYYNKHIRRR